MFVVWKSVRMRRLRTHRSGSWLRLRRQVPTFSHTLRGAWCSPPLSLWEFRGGKTRSSSAYPTARKSVSFLLLSQFPHVCLPGSNVSRLMFPVFVGLCFKEKNIFFYLGFWKEQNYVRQFNEQSFSFHEFLETRSFQEFKNPSFQESKFQTWICTVAVFFQIIPVLRCIHQSCAFIHLSIDPSLPGWWWWWLSCMDSSLLHLLWSWPPADQWGCVSWGSSPAPLSASSLFSLLLL